MPKRKPDKATISRNARARKLARKLETAEQAAERRRKDAERHAARRAAETPEQRQERLDKDCARIAADRARKKDAERRAVRRAEREEAALRAATEVAARKAESKRRFMKKYAEKRALRMEIMNKIIRATPIQWQPGKTQPGDSRWDAQGSGNVNIIDSKERITPWYPTQFNRSFIDYVPQTGSWIFQGLLQSSSTVTREEDRHDHIPLEPTVEIKEEPTDYNPTPSTSSANEFILPHEESTWTPSDSVVEPQITLSVANLSSPNDPDASDDLHKKKRKFNPSNTSTPGASSANGLELRSQSPVYSFGEFSNPSPPKEVRKDQFDVFGEYIAAKLRNLDRKSCAYTQKAIADIIFEAEMGKYLREECSDPQITSS